MGSRRGAIRGSGVVEEGSEAIDSSNICTTEAELFFTRNVKEHELGYRE